MKKYLLVIILVLFETTLFAQTNQTMSVSRNSVVEGGVGLGTVIAVVASWSRNESILWSMVHGVCSWLYVIYFALTRD